MRLGRLKVRYYRYNGICDLEVLQAYKEDLDLE